MAHILGCFRILQLPREHCAQNGPLLLPMVLCIQDGVHSLAAAANFPRKFLDIILTEMQEINIFSL